MPEIRPLSPVFAVAGQLRPEDLGRIAELGFRTIVNNRPDGEEAGQPSSDALAGEARRLGLAYRDLPVMPGRVVGDQALALAAMLDELPGPALAFCRTGSRSAALWALAAARHGNPDAIVAAAAAAGYDLEVLRPRLEALAGADPS